MCERLWVRVRACEGVRESVGVCEHVRGRASVCGRVWARARACERVRGRASVCEYVRARTSARACVSVCERVQVCGSRSVTWIWDGKLITGGKISAGLRIFRWICSYATWNSRVRGFIINLCLCIHYSASLRPLCSNISQSQETEIKQQRENL